ncbi:MAG: hypothetical protein U9N59_06070 [Campylobacterota bacterium]|nr:hypothetical protein [Campylobacterota bacterium]
MLKKLLIIASSVLILNAEVFNIELKKDSWNLVGTPIDLNISSLDLATNDILWQYKEQKWFTNLELDNYSKVETLNANEAFWVYSTSDKNISVNNTQNNTILNSLLKGWNMYSPTTNIPLDTYFNSEDISIIWSYNDNNWSVWDPNNLYQDFNYTTAQDIKVGEGSWVFGKTNFIPKITKLSTDDVESIWNLSFEIDTNVDYNNLDIGVKFVKHENNEFGDYDPDIGKFIYDGISIVNEVISNPTAVLIEGTGDSDCKDESDDGIDNCSFTQISQYDIGYDPNNILNNSIELNDNILTLKLGYIMMSQTTVSESSFKVATKYDIIITSNDQNLIKNSNIIAESFQIETMSKTINFTNTKGIMVEMQIK